MKKKNPRDWPISVTFGSLEERERARVIRTTLNGSKLSPRRSPPTDKQWSQNARKKDTRMLKTRGLGWRRTNVTDPAIRERFHSLEWRQRKKECNIYSCRTEL